MDWIGKFWRDECGALLSAETVAVGTITVIGATAGLSTVAKSVNSELGEVALAIRSLNQSYAYPGHTSRGGLVFTAGSSYTQPPVEKSLEEIRLDLQGIEKKEDSKPQPRKKKRNKDNDEEQAQADFPLVPNDVADTTEVDASEASALDKLDVVEADEPSA